MAFKSNGKFNSTVEQVSSVDIGVYNLQNELKSIVSIVIFLTFSLLLALQNDGLTLPYLDKPMFMFEFQRYLQFLKCQYEM